MLNIVYSHIFLLHILLFLILTFFNFFHYSKLNILDLNNIKRDISFNLYLFLILLELIIYLHNCLILRNSLKCKPFYNISNMLLNYVNQLIFCFHINLLLNFSFFSLLFENKLFF